MLMNHVDSATDIAHLAAGFAERRDSAISGVALELPQQRPLLQFFLQGSYSMCRLTSERDWEPVPGAAVWGASRIARLGRSESPLRVFVVILTQVGLSTLTRSSPAALAGERIAFRDIWPRESSLPDRIVEAPGFGARVDIVTDWLRRSPGPSRQHRTLLLADHIADGLLRGPVSVLARRTGQDLRTLRRRFRAALGSGPKASLRFARLQRALSQLHPRPWSGATREDVLLEYFDDAHFSKDFLRLATISPHQYRQAKLKFGDPLVNTVYGWSATNG